MSEEPARPRSLVIDMCGEYLRYLGPDVRQVQVTRLLGAFGVSAATVRVTMARLRADGWFTARKEGRETVHTITPALVAVLDEGRERIFAPPAQSWSGAWTMAVHRLSETDRSERAQLRRSLAWHGFGPLDTSTWLAPGDRRAELRGALDDDVSKALDLLLCESEGPEHDRDLARRCWDLDALAFDYRAFLDDHRDLAAQAPRLSGAAALRARTDLVGTFRHFPFRDPRLPVELRPAAWPGDDAHALFHTAYDALGPAARVHVEGLVGVPVPAPR
jgi:phenylacetic acid degradation operon negative regulatory protein